MPQVRLDNVSSFLDRSKCMFPTSRQVADVNGKAESGIERASIPLGSNEKPNELIQQASQIACAGPAVLKAAWLLTIQCFIITDVLCFRYNGPSERGPKWQNRSSQSKESTQISALYVTRVDRSETVHSFLQRLDRSQEPATISDPAGYNIGVFEQHSPYHECNTGLCYKVGNEARERNGFEGSASPELDLAVVINWSSESKAFANLEYNMSYLTRDMALSVARTFQHIFAQLSESPNYTLLQDIDLCPPKDRETFKDLTDSISLPRERCLHDLILDQCQRRPNQLAIQSWDGDLTYGELDALSSKLAWHLKELGVAPEIFVLSCFEKSAWATVARLAILRAGGAYISIHASNPPAYLASVIERSKTQILLTDSYFADRFRDVVPTVVEISPAWLRALPPLSETPVCDDVRSDNACLILFTSGSTGMPKGIIQSHSSYATAIQDYARRLKLGSHTRFLQFDDYAFDISNLEFLVPLILGGCCCVPKPTNSVQHLTEQIRLLNANIVFLTPTVAIKIEPLDVPCLETICVGGEPLSKELITKWDGQKTKLVNQYGMGEVAICCVLNDDNVDISDNAKVGRPPTGAIWIVDPASPGRLMPIGAVGEILIEGPHLARGYLDSTALKNTSAGFLKSTPRWIRTLHPDRATARIYRSGDLGRWNADGTITHLGRKDTILKLDGCRIDALEVEHQAHKSLTDKDTVVVDLLGAADGQCDPSLTLFMYLDGHPTSMSPRAKGVPALVDAVEDIFAKEKVQEIKLAIAQSLPRYMIPTKWILCTWIPRTASKKIDRKKLHLLGEIYHSAQPGGLDKDSC